MSNPSNLDQAARYVAKCPPAISGQHGHDTAFGIVCEVVNGFALDADDAARVLAGWNQSCQPPWSDRELQHKIEDAIRSPHQKPRGHKLSKRHQEKHQSSAGYTHTTKPSNATPTPKPVRKVYDLSGTDELPEPIHDGARLLIETVFRPGEGVRISPARLKPDGDGEEPDGAGPCLSREEWLRKLSTTGGDPNGIFSSRDKTGIYIALNPYRVGGTKDADVTAYRHALVEFDDGISPAEQLRLYERMRLPCAAIIYSGGKSVHAWVKVDASDRAEYDERVKTLYQYIADAGFANDPANKNPGRLSRLPFCVRGDRRQELLALNTGAESWSAWQGEIETEGFGTVSTIDDLLAFVPSTDPNTLIGQRWLCRGGSCLLVGPSGVGKSSLAMQMAACWAIGRPAFGITPVRPLKVLLVQAENDIGDLAEMVQGVVAGIGIDPFNNEAEHERFRANLLTVRNTTHTGFAFTQSIRRLIDAHRPDLVVLDPLLSFIGADISRQEVCSQFLRNWIGPISEATGVAWLCVHHTGKPSTDPKAKAHWRSSDYSYAGLGSSELTNWTRATAILEQAEQGIFRLMLTKRGSRAGATEPSGEPTSTVWLKHSQGRIYWEQIQAPTAPDEIETPKEKKEKPKSKIEQIDGILSKGSSFFFGCLPDGESKRAISERMVNWLSGKDTPIKVDVEWRTCCKVVENLFDDGRLAKRDGLYIRGENA